MSYCEGCAVRDRHVDVLQTDLAVLQRAHAELEAKHRWHPYPEEKPEESKGWFLVSFVPTPGIASNRAVTVMNWDENREWDAFTPAVTAWQPLPPPYRTEP